MKEKIKSFEAWLLASTLILIGFFTFLLPARATSTTSTPAQVQTQNGNEYPTHHKTQTSTQSSNSKQHSDYND